MAPKEEFSPLLPAGFHDVTLEDLERLFVEPFTPPDHRRTLLTRLLAFLTQLLASGLPCEIWLNGSFATEKVDPEDVDIAVFVREDDVNALADVQRSVLEGLFGDPLATKARYGCDAYILLLENEANRSYWRGWFGFTRDERPKGIPRIMAA